MSGMKKILEIFGFENEVLEENEINNETKKEAIREMQQKNKLVDIKDIKDKTKRKFVEEREQNVNELEKENTKAKMEVVSIEITDFADSKRITDFLKEGKIVVMNMEEVKNDLARRVMDFVSGTLYAISGKLESAGKRVFILAPENVNIERFAIGNRIENEILSKVDIRYNEEEEIIRKKNEA